MDYNRIKKGNGVLFLVTTYQTCVKILMEVLNIMSLEGKNIAIILEDLHEDPEFWYPYFRFQEEGATVTAVAPEVKEYKSKHNYAVKPYPGPKITKHKKWEFDWNWLNPSTIKHFVAAKDAKAKDFDAVVVPGGWSPDKMRRSPELMSFLAECYQQKVITAAICHGPWMLCSIEGALRGRKATCMPAMLDDLVNAGAEFIDEPVVRDEHVITSRVPNDLPQFCKEIIEALKK